MGTHSISLLTDAAGGGKKGEEWLQTNSLV